MSGRLEALLADEGATVAFGARLARVLRAGDVVHLRGELGAGKTTLVRGVLHALGHAGAIKSPTYTLVESYELPGLRLHHFDLYRLRDPLELEDLGIRDYVDTGATLLFEWPERGAAAVPGADLVLELGIAEHGRSLVANARSARGAALLEELA